MHIPNSPTLTQLELIGEIADMLATRRIDWWLFGGWAMDFNAGEITRDHADIELFIWQEDVGAVRAALTSRGFAAPAVLYPLECQSFVKAGQEIGCWSLVKSEDRVIHTPGRWADWPWAAGSFDDPPQALRGVTAPVMSLAGLLDMKERFAAHPHGAPLRDKDVRDIALLRRLVATAAK